MYAEDRHANSDEHYRPGYNPEFVRKVIAKRRRAEIARVDAEAAAAREERRQQASRDAAERALLKQQADVARLELAALKAKLETVMLERDAYAAAEKVEALERARAIIAKSDGLMKYTHARVEAKAILLFGVTKSELRSNRRNREITFARQFVMYWTARMTAMSTPLIGKLMGGFDHTTILHGKDAYARKRAAMGRNLRKAR